MRNLVLLGAPFSGKGTQSKFLKSLYSYSHICVGDILRKQIKLKSSIGNLAFSFVKNGTMVPNNIILELINEEIGKHPVGTKFVFDGIPRTLEQIAGFNKIIEHYEIPNPLFVLLEVTTEELIRRARGRALIDGRIDDQDSAIIENRINLYKELTLPVIDYYSEVTTIHYVDGGRAVYKVHENIKKLVLTSNFPR